MYILARLLFDYLLNIRAYYIMYTPCVCVVCAAAAAVVVVLQALLKRTHPCTIMFWQFV